MKPSVLGAPLTLPCGVTLPNRLAKAAMSELLADPRNRATPAHQILYDVWARSGLGLLLTGNVQVDRRQHGGRRVTSPSKAGRTRNNWLR